VNEQQKTELLQPKIVGNPGMSDAELLALLYINDIPVKVNITTNDLEIYLISIDLWIEFKNNIAKSVELARDSLVLFSPEIDIQTYQSMFESMIQGLVDEPTFAFNATNQAEVLAMTDDMVSWAAQNIPGLTEGDILRARP